jgi:hypothetical protein
MSLFWQSVMRSRIQHTLSTLHGLVLAVGGTLHLALQVRNKPPVVVGTKKKATMVLRSMGQRFRPTLLDNMTRIVTYWKIWDKHSVKRRRSSNPEMSTDIFCM